SESSTVVRGGSFLVALANACRIFARVTMPTSLFPSTGHALDSVALQHRGDVAERGIWFGGNDLASHHISNLAGMRFDVLGGSRPFIRYHLEPPRMSFGRARPPGVGSDRLRSRCRQARRSYPQPAPH